MNYELLWVNIDFLNSFLTMFRGGVIIFWLVGDLGKTQRIVGASITLPQPVEGYQKNGSIRPVSVINTGDLDPHINENYRSITQLIERLIDDCSLSSLDGHLHSLKVAGSLANQEIYTKSCGIQRWLEEVPTASALEPLYHPERESMSDGLPIDDLAQNLFRNISDAIGLRSRRFRVQQVLLAEAQRHKERAAVESFRVLSIACGSADPIIEVVAHLVHNLHQKVEITAIDYDHRALKLAQKYADAANVTDCVELIKDNILRPAGVVAEERLPFFLNSAHCVDIVGILEYLKPENKMYSYNGVLTTRVKQAGAVTLLRNSYAMVAPGGVLLFANMSPDHPQLRFTLDIVKWPHLVPRSVAEMLELCDQAGIEGEVDVYLPQDQVYPVYVLRKPISDSKNHADLTVDVALDPKIDLT